MSAPTPVGSPLGPIITRHLAIKRALGRGYAREADVFAHLDRFLGARHADLTPETFALWGAAIAHLTPQVRRERMRIVRMLCLYRQRSEPGCFVPDARGFPLPHPPVRPHLFTPEKVVRLPHAADALGSSPRLHITKRST